MTLRDETNGLHGATCPTCGKRLALQVCGNGSRFYLGYECCRSASRETGYYHRREYAELELECVRRGLKPWVAR